MIRALGMSARGPPPAADPIAEEASTLYKTLDARHVFRRGGMPSGDACRIRIYETPRPEEGCPTVIVASQIPGCAASVTNFAEDIATEVVRMQRARHRLEPGDPRHAFVWVEHYPPGLLRLLPGGPDGFFRRVTFRSSPGGDLTCPEWGPFLSRQDVEASLLGCPLGA